jgi:hypothetical protein
MFQVCCLAYFGCIICVDGESGSENHVCDKSCDVNLGHCTVWGTMKMFYFNILFGSCKENW